MSCSWCLTKLIWKINNHCNYTGCVKPIRLILKGIIADFYKSYCMYVLHFPVFKARGTGKKVRVAQEFTFFRSRGIWWKNHTFFCRSTCASKYLFNNSFSHFQKNVRIFNMLFGVRHPGQGAGVKLRDIDSLTSKKLDSMPSLDCDCNLVTFWGTENSLWGQGDAEAVS